MLLLVDDQKNWIQYHLGNALVAARGRHTSGCALRYCECVLGKDAPFTGGDFGRI